VGAKHFESLGRRPRSPPSLRHKQSEQEKVTMFTIITPVFAFFTTVFPIFAFGVVVSCVVFLGLQQASDWAKDMSAKNSDPEQKAQNQQRNSIES